MFITQVSHAAASPPTSVHNSTIMVAALIIDNKQVCSFCEGAIIFRCAIELVAKN
jgi:hypothetical protein